MAEWAICENKTWLKTRKTEKEAHGNHDSTNSRSTS